MLTFPEYESFDAMSLAGLIKSGVLHPRELLEAAIERIEAYNPQLNAVVLKMYDQARAAIQQPIPDGIFQGVPFLLKDLLADFAGAPLQFGSHLAEGWVSTHDSEIVQRMKKAGLIVLGRTNTPEFGLSPVTESDLYGSSNNPWDVSRTSGGSSGGSAAAVAARMVPMAHGSDGAGSIRIPSAYCGVFGLKPSRGRVPIGPKALRLWQGMVIENVMTRSVRDAAAMLDILSGSELGSPISLPPVEKSFLSGLTEPPPKLRIAMTDQPFFPGLEVDETYKAAVKQAALLCEQLGHQVVLAAPKIDVDETLLAFMIVIAAETANGIKRLASTMQRPLAYSKLETATAVLCEVGKHFTAADFAWASYVLDKTAKILAEFHVEYDMLLTPTMPIPAPLVGAVHPDRLEQNILELLRRVPCGPVLRKLTKTISSKQFAFIPFVPLSNISGQPSMSVPLYWDANNMPIGIHFTGRFAEERILLRFAAQLEEALPWAERKPKR